MRLHARGKTPRVSALDSVDRGRCKSTVPQQKSVELFWIYSQGLRSDCGAPHCSESQHAAVVAVGGYILIPSCAGQRDSPSWCALVSHFLPCVFLVCINRGDVTYLRAHKEAVAELENKTQESQWLPTPGCR